jgi:hypothetical protein
LLEVGQRLALALESAQLDVMDENIARPAVGERGVRICDALRLLLELCEEHDVVSPGQIANNLLAIW